MGAPTSHTFGLILQRELTLLIRDRAEIVNPLCFFLIITALFPLGLSADPDTLALIGPGVIWVSALLATIMGLTAMFRSDFEDGSLEQLLVSPRSLTVAVLAKVAAHWCAAGLPLVLISPLLAVMMNMPPNQIWVLGFSLLLGTPTLSLVGAIGVALTMGLGRGGLLLAILILPLYTPVLIFGAGMTAAAGAGMPIDGAAYLLGALLALALTLAPFAIGAALRATVN